ncbi:MAG: type III-B CRISPR module RAMP protein Cmr6 [Chloroflexota bacterium]
MPPTYLTPSDTARILAAHAERCANLSLILKRYVPNEVIWNLDVEGAKNQKWRDQWLRQLCTRFSSENEALVKLQQSTLDRWTQQTQRAIRFEMRLEGRMVVGMGEKGSLETGLTLDHVTGLPFIPGSALKGLCRAYGLYMAAAALGVPVLMGEQLRWFIADEKDKPHPTPLELLDALLVIDPAQTEQRQAALSTLMELMYRLKQAYAEKITLNEALDLAALDSVAESNVYRHAFGSTENAGACVFYNAVVSALPTNRTLFEADVMTPHFGSYYGDKSAPHDADSPNPINFLGVAAKTRFAFAVGLRPGIRDEQRVEKVVEWAAEWLRLALNELGIGSKTSAGYGVFRPVPTK